MARPKISYSRGTAGAEGPSGFVTSWSQSKMSYQSGGSFPPRPVDMPVSYGYSDTNTAPGYGSANTDNAARNLFETENLFRGPVNQTETANVLVRLIICCILLVLLGVKTETAIVLVRLIYCSILLVGPPVRSSNITFVTCLPATLSQCSPPSFDRTT